MGAKTLFSVLYFGNMCTTPQNELCLYDDDILQLYVQVHFSNVKYDSTSYVSK